eukprot:scaffold1532_cov111-Skeletonema_dohrnii-CCMP3373.AAC.6
MERCSYKHGAHRNTTNDESVEFVSVLSTQSLPSQRASRTDDIEEEGRSASGNLKIVEILLSRELERHELPTCIISFSAGSKRGGGRNCVSNRRSQSGQNPKELLRGD